MALASCEEVYNPELDSVDDYLFVEGRFLANSQVNELKLYKTLNFNSETTQYPSVSGAEVTLIDDKGAQVGLEEADQGTYLLNQILESDRQYHISIEWEGEVYESTVQPVPEIPGFDTVYGVIETKLTLPDGENSVEDLNSERGVQLYTDINNEGELKNYWFYGRKVLQYVYYIDSMMFGELVQLPVYSWKSYYPSGAYNIAGPPEYSTSDAIIKHPLEFFGNYDRILADTQYFSGWIYIIGQYGITEENYQYYEDLNKQLEAEGKIFDPIYVQAEGNIKCTSNPAITVLGNFEILSCKEHRYFLSYNNRNETINLKKIPYFYEIPESGETVETQPDFWESMGKRYP